MNVLSLFDGMSCGQLALQRAGIKYLTYYASEIEPNAIAITQKRFPETIQIWNVCNITERDIYDISLLIGGSPCQGFSKAGDELNFNCPKSKLFFEFVRVMDLVKPKFFLLENVTMKKEWVDVISGYLGVQPIEINSSLVSAQSRSRLYWTNIPNVTQPKDKGLVIRDILEKDVDFSPKDGIIELEKHSSKNGLICVGGLKQKKMFVSDGKKLQRNFSQGERIYSVEGKCPTLMATSGGTAGNANALITNNIKSGLIRKLTTTEVERLQTVPDGYTAGVSKTQRHRMLGNGWTVDVIAHILKGIS